MRKEILLPFTKARKTHSNVRLKSYIKLSRHRLYVPVEWSGRRESNGPSMGSMLLFNENVKIVGQKLINR